MHRFRLAVATRCFELPLRSSLDAAAATGAEGVQFDLRNELNVTELRATGRRDLRRVLDELGLQVAAATFTLRRPLADEHELDRRIAALKQAMTWSYELQARVLTFRLGQLPPEQEAQTLREILTDLARHANHVGVSLAVLAEHRSPEAVQRLLATIDSGPIGVEIDPAQIAGAGGDPVAALRTWHAMTQHVQLRDSLAGNGGAGGETAVGEGAVSWVELLATLSEMEYAGWLTAIRTQGTDKAGDMRRAIAYVRRMLLGGG
jgi:sugar phosphate isomerase/epimerase